MNTIFSIRHPSIGERLFLLVPNYFLSGAPYANCAYFISHLIINNLIRIYFLLCTITPIDDHVLKVKI